MSSIVPNGQIRFLTQIPIDANYENSLDFLSEVEQRTYFLSQQPVHTMLGATRIRDGVIAVNSLADNLLSANYMMFQNTNFSNKWFYAFITNIEYVNNNMSHVYYQIDDIQTWLFDVQLAQCFVEREHTATDGMFEHLVDEGINVSEYVVSNEIITADGTDADKHKYYNRWGYMLWMGERPQLYYDTETGKITDADFETTNIQINAGVLSGAFSLGGALNRADGTWYEISSEWDELSWNDMNPLEKLNCYIYWAVRKNRADTLLGLYIYPYELISFSDYSIGRNPITTYLNSPTFTRGERINGYLPVNAKLYNSPYCIHQIESTDGQKEILQPEYCLTQELGYEVLCCNSMTPALILVPMQYEGENYCWKKAITIDNFPQCAIPIDGYEAWVASGGLAKTIINTASGVINGGIGMSRSIAKEDTIGTVANALSIGTSIANNVVDMTVAKNLPAISKGTQNPMPLTANRLVGFHFRKKCATSDVLKSIDDYFTMFGYKVNKLKQPSRRNRPHFTYLKTKGLHVNGGAPADAIQRIETIYDNGIRFWVNPAEVGNYNVNNAPV